MRETKTSSLHKLAIVEDRQKPETLPAQQNQSAKCRIAVEERKDQSLQVKQSICFNIRLGITLYLDCYSNFLKIVHIFVVSLILIQKQVWNRFLYFFSSCLIGQRQKLKFSIFKKKKSKILIGVCMEKVMKKKFVIA